MHFGLDNANVSKVGLATHSALDGPYVDTYLVHQTEGMSYPVVDVSPYHHSYRSRNCRLFGVRIDTGELYLLQLGLVFFSV
jgi:hypothetical protein